MSKRKLEFALFYHLCHPSFPEASSSSFWISLNCFTIRFTSAISTPAPLAIRCFLDGFNRSGFRSLFRSHGVDDCFHLSHLLLILFRIQIRHLICRRLPIPGIIPMMLDKSAHLFHLVPYSPDNLQSQTELSSSSAAIFLAFSSSSSAPAFSISVSTSPIPRYSGCHSVRIKLLQIRKLLSHTDIKDRFSCHCLDRQVPHRLCVSPSNLVTITPSMPIFSLNGTCYIHRILTGHRIHNQDRLMNIHCFFDLLKLCHHIFIYMQDVRLYRGSRYCYHSLLHVPSLLSQYPPAYVLSPMENTSTPCFSPLICNCLIAAGR